jgi:hypothetical protein
MIAAMGYVLSDGDPPAVAYLTFVPFLPDRRCVAVPDGRGRVSLPAGRVRRGEHWLLDTCLRVPLETAGFRMQRAHVFAVDGDHAYAWLDGDRYTGWRPHATVEWVTGAPEEIADRLAAVGRGTQARAVRDAAHSFGHQADAEYYADNVRLLEPAYLRGTTVQQGSGFGGDADEWRANREMIVDGIDRDGSLLDLGCANGLLMESVARWAAERGHRIEPYGADLAPGLAAEARRRLPAWADRIEVGNAVDYHPSGGRRFTFVHTLLDCVPAHRRADLVRHALRHLVEPGGRLLVSHYQRAGGTDRTAGQHLRDLGFPVAGEAGSDGARPHQTAWVDAPAQP